MTRCEFCNKEITDMEEAYNTIDFMGNVTYYCDEKCYKSDMNSMEDCNTYNDEQEYSDDFNFVSITPSINQQVYVDRVMDEFNTMYGSDMTKNRNFKPSLNKFLNEKMDEGYPSPQLIYGIINVWKNDCIDRVITLDNISDDRFKINCIFSKFKALKNKTVSVMKDDLNYGVDASDYEYFLDEPFKWTSKSVEKEDMANVSSEEVEKPTKANEYEYKPRRFPTTINNEEIDDGGEFIMKPIDLLKKGKMNYIAFGYLQSISDRDKNDYDKFRKVYVKDINNSTMAKKCKGISRNTVAKALLRFEDLGLLSSVVFKDDK
ncbi:MAG: hypothetical protein ACRCXA_03930 [Peptostreptococcaceae bacterium]